MNTKIKTLKSNIIQPKSIWLVMAVMSCFLLAMSPAGCDGQGESGREVFNAQSGYGLAGGVSDDTMASKLVAGDSVATVVVAEEVMVMEEVEFEAEKAVPAEAAAAALMADESAPKR